MLPSIKPGWKGGKTFEKASPVHRDPLPSAQIGDPSRKSSISLNYSEICKIKKEAEWNGVPFILNILERT
jgi:hypothetical protein